MTKKIKLRKTHWEQMIWYVEIIRRYEIYYGNKKQFYKRDAEIMKFLKQIETGERD